MLDVGANTDCKPEWLAQFALMGDVYARTMLGIPSPRVGRLWTGSDPFSASSELLSRATRGLGMPSIFRAKTSPMMANCASHSGLQSVFAPASSMNIRPPVVGRTAPIAGRRTGDALDGEQGGGEHRAAVARAHHGTGAAACARAGGCATSDESFFARTAFAG